MANNLMARMYCRIFSLQKFFPWGLGLLFNVFSLKFFFEFPFYQLDQDDCLKSGYKKSTLCILFIALLFWLVLGSLYILDAVSAKKTLCDHFLNLMLKEYLKEMSKYEDLGKNGKFCNYGSKIPMEIANDKDKVLAATHEAGRVICKWFNGSAEKIQSATIIQGEGCMDLSEPATKTNDRLFEDMCMSVSGFIAKSMFINYTDNVFYWTLEDESDFQYNYLRTFLLAKRHPNANLPKKISSAGKISTPTAKVVKFLIRKTHQAATSVLEANKSMLMKITIELLTKKELSYEQLKGLLGPQPKSKATLFQKFCMDGARYSYPRIQTTRHIVIISAIEEENFTSPPNNTEVAKQLDGKLDCGDTMGELLENASKEIPLKRIRFQMHTYRY